MNWAGCIFALFVRILRLELFQNCSKILNCLGEISLNRFMSGTQAIFGPYASQKSLILHYVRRKMSLSLVSELTKGPRTGKIRLGYQSRKVECLSMTEIENRTAGDLFCDGPRPSDLRKCSIQCPQKRCVLSPWSQWVNVFSNLHLKPFVYLESMFENMFAFNPLSDSVNY